ncbi:MAG: hypothetical protein ACOH18_02070 [Candidatus Saccharimonadaceae bacterium]
MNKIGLFSVLILLCLSIFQLAEYLICEVINLPGLTWARVGYVSITLLPPLGVSLAMAIAGKKSVATQLSIYTIAGSFIAYFLFVAHGLTNQVCAGNYVIFTTHPEVIPIYGLYYYGSLIVLSVLSFRWSQRMKSVGKKKALRALAIGNMAFMIPTTTVNLLNPTTTEAIPSIMCGFAVLLALIILFWVLPNAGTLRRSTS